MAEQGQKLSETLKNARQHQGMTQGELGTKVGVSQGTISFWENGTETPTIEHLILLALALPEIIETLQGRERELLQRILRLERDLYPGRCACTGCSCQPASTEITVTAPS